MARPKRRRSNANGGDQTRTRTGTYTRTLDTAERDAAAARMRVTGIPFSQIAAALGFADESGARKAAKRALDAVPVEAAEELRTVENARLDRLLERLAPGIEAGDVPSIETARKISESRRRLFGLDGPIQVNMTETTQADLAMQDMLNEARMRAAAERAKATGEPAD